MDNLLIQSFDSSDEFSVVLDTSKQSKANDAEMLRAYRGNYKKGKAAKKEGDFAMAYVFFKDALNCAKLVNWKDAILYTKLEVADIDLATNKYNRAYNNYMTCLNLALINDLDPLVSIVYFKLSKYYLSKGNNILSREYNDKAVKASSC